MLLQQGSSALISKNAENIASSALVGHAEVSQVVHSMLLQTYPLEIPGKSFQQKQSLEETQNDVDQLWKTPVLVINLDDQPHHYARVFQMAQAFGISKDFLTRLPAVKGSALTEQQKLDIVSLRARGEIDFGQRESHQGLPSWGAVGCTLSHIQAWKTCLEKNCTILVVEDDVLFVGSTHTWKRLAHQCIGGAERIWDVCLIGSMRPNGQRTPKVGPGMRLIEPWPKGKAFWGTEAYFITPNGARLLLQYALPINQQTDYYMQSVAAFHGLRLACSWENLAMQKFRMDSSIQTMCLKCFVPNISMKQFLVLLLCVIGIVVMIRRRFLYLSLRAKIAN
jgi:GR25 family glycosyltransferase involved in LPS biosynthesis